MKFCDAHWAQLKKAIADRGLSHLIAKDGQTAMENIEAEINGQANASTYDPLMNATMMIYGHAVKFGGLYLMLEKEGGGSYCPLCEADLHIKEPPPGGGTPADGWIAGCCDSILAHCRELGLVQGVQ